MKFILIILLSLAVPFPVCAQIKIGDKVQLEQLSLAAVNHATIDSTKILVLDFWATWCAPCIASFSHLDSIQKEYKNDVQLIAVSDETSAKVSRFLEKRKYSFSFFIDETRDLFKLFDIESRPLTAVILPDKTLAWVGNSSELTSVLNDIHAKSLEPVPYSLQKYHASPATTKKENNIYTYQISASDTGDMYEAKTQKGAYTDSAINIYYRAASVLEIVQDLSGISDLQLINNRPDLDTTLINITAKSRSNLISYQTGKENIIADLQRIFNFRIRNEYRKNRTYLLEISDKKRLEGFLEKIPGGGMVESKEDKYIITRLSLSNLASFFQKKLGVFVSYPGNSTFNYSMDLPRFKTMEELNRQLESKYGLRLKKSSTSVLMVEIN